MISLGKMNHEEEQHSACACILSKIAERMDEALGRWERELHLESIDKMDVMVDGLKSCHTFCKDLLNVFTTVKTGAEWDLLEFRMVRNLKELGNKVIDPWNAVKSQPEVAKKCVTGWQKLNPLLTVQVAHKKWQARLERRRQDNRVRSARQFAAPPLNRNHLTFFVASSSEGELTARKLIKAIKADAATAKWVIHFWKNPGVFTKGESTLESLEGIFRKCDFGIYLLTADDILVMRSKQTRTARGNVIFELGMGIGIHGRRRSFIVHEKVDHISDLAGISTIPYVKLKGKDTPSAAEIKGIVETLVLAVAKQLSSGSKER